MLKPRETVIFANDFRAMITWYQTALGLKTTRLEADDYHYCNLENEHGIQLGIADAQEMGVAPADRNHNGVVLQFQVADLPTFFKHIEDSGGSIAFGPSLDKKFGFWFGGIKDMEGNPIWIVDENCP